MASVDVCNTALSLLGAASITSITGSEPNELRCNVHYARARDSVLRAFDWACARKKTEIDATDADWATGTAYVAGDLCLNDDVIYRCILDHTAGALDDEPGVGAVEATYWQEYPDCNYSYVYEQPSDCLRILGINERLSEAGSPYEIENGWIFCNDEDIVLRYLYQNTTDTSWPDYVYDAIAYELARRLAYPITQNRRIVNDMEILAAEALRTAKAAEARHQYADDAGGNAWVEAQEG